MVCLLSHFASVTTVWAQSVAPVTDAIVTTDNKELAKAHFKKGVQFHKQGDLQAAYSEFQKAQELSPHFKVLYNVAQTAYALGRHGESLRAYLAVLRDPATQLLPREREEANSRVEELKQLLGQVHLVCSVEAGQVVVDDGEAVPCPMQQDLWLSPGQHQLVLEAGTPEQRSIAVEAGTQSVVSFVERTPAPQADSEAMAKGASNDKDSVALPQDAALIVPAKAPEPPLTSEPPAGPSHGFWWTVGGAGALGAGAVVTGLLALDQNKKAKSLAGQYPTDSDELSSHNKKANRLALASDVLLGSAVVTLGAAVAIEFKVFQKKDSGAASVALRLSPTRFSVLGSF